MFQSLTVALGLLSSMAFATTHVTKYQADFVVPDESTEATPVATRTFAVDYVVTEAEGQLDQVSFQIPWDLTGKNILIEMAETEKYVGAGGVLVRKLVGSLGEATCYGPWMKTQCVYRFVGLQLDKMETLNALASRYSLESVEFWDNYRRARIFRCSPAAEIQTEKKDFNLPAVTNCGLDM